MSSNRVIATAAPHIVLPVSANTATLAVRWSGVLASAAVLRRLPTAVNVGWRRLRSLRSHPDEYVDVASGRPLEFSANLAHRWLMPMLKSHLRTFNLVILWIQVGSICCHLQQQERFSSARISRGW